MTISIRTQCSARMKGFLGSKLCQEAPFDDEFDLIEAKDMGMDKQVNFEVYIRDLNIYEVEVLMRITIIAEEELTHKDLTSLKNNFAMSGLGRLLYVLLVQGVDALAAISTVADLDWVAMVAQMNARTLSGIIAMDVEDFGMAWGNAIGRLLIDSANQSGARKQRATNGKRLLCKAVEISIIESGATMSTLKVVASRIMALEVANAGG